MIVSYFHQYLFVVLMCVCFSICVCNLEGENNKQFPATGTQDESELLVKYNALCGSGYRVVEFDTSRNTKREIHKPTHTHTHTQTRTNTFNRMANFVAKEYESTYLGLSPIAVDVSVSGDDFKFYSRRTARFAADALYTSSDRYESNFADTLSPISDDIYLTLSSHLQSNAIESILDNSIQSKNRNNLNNEQTYNDLTITCELQRFINIDVCKVSNYQGRIDTRKIEEYLSQDECVEFAEFSVQLKPPMLDENNKIIENSINIQTSAISPHNLPDDEYFKTHQWFLSDDMPYSINAQTAWNTFVDNSHSVGSNNTGFENVGVVGIVDTGAWMTYPQVIHEDLVHKMWRNEADCDFDGLDSDDNGYIDDCNGWNFGANNNDLSDYHGHGTAVSGAVGAKPDNGVGVASIGWPVKIMTLKTYFRTSEFAKIVNYVAGFKVKIMNGSFAYPSPSESLKELVTVGQQNGILMVFAASNENCDNDAIVRSRTGTRRGCDLYPASLPQDNILSVCSSNEHGQKSYFSSYGKSTVDVCAPGSSIFTTRFSSTSPSEYGHSSGTSFSSPIVAGIAGLVAMQNPTFTYLEISDAIKNSCTMQSDLKNMSACRGIVDAGKALEWVP